MDSQRFPNLRKTMAWRQDSIKILARAIKLKPWCLERRLYGKTSWRLDEIKRVCRRYHLTFEFLFYEEAKK